MSIHRPRRNQSNGCAKCRERNKKCDEQTPKCGACVRNNYLCLYPSNHPDLGKKALQTRKRSQWAISWPENDQTANASTDQQPDIAQGNPSFYVQYFVDVTMKGANSPVESHAHGLAKSIRVPLLFIKNETGLAYSCLAACAYASFGRSRNIPKLELESIERYSQCMREVSKLLDNPSNHNGIETMVAVILLALFEQRYVASNLAWAEHLRGLELLLNTWDPRAFDKLPERLLLEHCRLDIIVASIYQGRPTFLNLQDWKTLPWASCPDDKRSDQLLLDIMAEVASHVDQLIGVEDWYHGQATHDRSYYVDILERQGQAIRTRFFKLHNWRQAFENMQKNTRWAWEENTTLRERHGIDPVFGMVFYFSDFKLASIVLHFEVTLILFCAIAMEANELMRLLDMELIIEFNESDIPRPLIQTSPLSALGIPAFGFIHTARSAAVRISKIVDFSLSTIYGGMGGNYLVLPLTVAYYTMGADETSYGKWISSIMGCIRAEADKWKVTDSSQDQSAAPPVNTRRKLPHTLRRIIQSWNSNDSWGRGQVLEDLGATAD